MCTLLLKPANVSLNLTRENLDSLWDCNPDGFGFAYASKGELVSDKTLSRSKVAKMLNTIPPESPAILHWRYGTHGTTLLANCHPFPIPLLGGDWLGAHNGILSGQYIPEGENITDSEAFFRGLQTTDPRGIESLIQRAGGGGSKMALLSSEGDWVLANEHLGEWVDGVWHSNLNAFCTRSKWGFGEGRGGLSLARWDEPAWEPLLCHYCDSPESLFFDPASGIVACSVCKL